MHQLYRYIAAIKGEQSSIKLVDRIAVDTSYDDAGVRVEGEEVTFRFSNGVSLDMKTEFEHLSPENEGADDLICSEYWISYRVSSVPPGLSVTPQEKFFTNRCQEAFWLKMQRIQADL